MRHFVYILGIFLMAAACSSGGSKSSSGESQSEAQVSEENIVHLHLDVKGMTCEGCENAIKAGINKLEGIREASASHTHEEVMVVYDSTKISLHDIEHAIADAGYTVEGESEHPHQQKE
jgi:copper chaperone CopZ